MAMRAGRARFAAIGLRRTARTTPTQLGDVLPTTYQRRPPRHRRLVSTSTAETSTQPSSRWSNPAVCRLDCLDNPICYVYSLQPSCLQAARPQGFQLAFRSSARSYDRTTPSSLGLSSRSPAVIQLHRCCRWPGRNCRRLLRRASPATRA